MTESDLDEKPHSVPLIFEVAFFFLFLLDLLFPPPPQPARPPPFSGLGHPIPSSVHGKILEELNL